MSTMERFDRGVDRRQYSNRFRSSQPLTGTLYRKNSGKAAGKTNALLVTSSLLVIAFAALTISVPSTEAHVTHSPILITSNSDFDGDHGINGGSGTALDPWVISNWDISADTNNAIEIKNTTDYFVVRNVYIHASTLNADKDGILLYNVTHGGVDSSELTGEMECGILIDSCSNISIAGNNITDIRWRSGVEAISSSWVTVASNNISNCDYCVRLYLTNNYTVAGNTISDQLGGAYGISFGYCPNGIVSGNHLSNLYEGIVTYGQTGRNATISSNTIANATQGGILILTDASLINTSDNKLDNASMGLQLCNGICVLNNSFSNMSSMLAIYFNQALNVTMRGNVMNSSSVYIFGNTLYQYSTHTISQDNMVNGKPLRYYKNSSGVTLDAVPVGELIVVNCTGFEAKNLSITDAYVGMQVAHSEGVLVSGCNLSGHSGFGMDLRACKNFTATVNLFADDRYGIYCASSLTNATFANNTVTRIEYSGFKIWSGSRINITGNIISFNGLPSNQAAIELSYFTGGNITGNHIINNSVGIYLATNTVNIRIHHNNFVNNTIQVYDVMSNKWDDGYPSGGNYWDDYAGSDGDHDGIGDMPYVIDSDSQDNYPLMQPIPEFSDFLIPILALIGIVTLMARRRYRIP